MADVFVQNLATCELVSNDVETLNTSFDGPLKRKAAVIVIVDMDPISLIASTYTK